jgi:hypothetical protein
MHRRRDSRSYRFMQQLSRIRGLLSRLERFESANSDQALRRIKSGRLKNRVWVCAPAGEKPRHIPIQLESFTECL